MIDGAKIAGFVEKWHKYRNNKFKNSNILHQCFDFEPIWNKRYLNS